MATKETKIVDEYIEAVWILTEKGTCTVPLLKEYFNEEYDQSVADQLISQDLAVIDADTQEITYTEKGTERGRLLIRAHRLAERLLYDVLRIEDYEIAACEFEHILDTDLIDGICTLLGHPRRCPDGLPIPEGACCRAEQKTIRSPSVSLLELQPEESGRVVAVNADNDHQLHLLDNLQIRPGTVLKVHQVSPSIVIECDGSTIAIDEEVASSIYVWRLTADRYHEISHGHPRGPRHRRDHYDCGPEIGREGRRFPRKHRGWRFRKDGQ